MAAKSYFKVLFPTKPYLKKYIQFLYGNPCTFSDENYLSVLAANLLRKNEARNKLAPHFTKQHVDDYCTTITIMFPISFMRNSQYGTDLTNQHVHTINKVIERQFEEDLYRYCTLITSFKVPLDQSLQEFCRTYHIEIDEDITFDALKKKEYRYRIAKQAFAQALTLPKIPQVMQLILL